MGRHSKPDDSTAPDTADAGTESLQREVDDLRARYPNEAAIIDQVGDAGRALGQVDLDRWR